jgi:hypothetical protein
MALTNTRRKKKRYGWQAGEPRSLQERDIVRKRWSERLLDNPATTEYAKSNRLNLKMTEQEMSALHQLSRMEGVPPGIVVRRLIMARSFELLAKSAVTHD